MEKTLNPIRILIIDGKLICGGVESFLMNIYRNIDRTMIQFDFLVHYKEKFFYDDEIERMGGRIYRLSFRNDKNLFKYKADLNDFFTKHPEYSIVWGHMDGLASIYLKIAKKHGVKCTIAHSHITSAEKSLKGLIKRLLRRKIPLYSDYRFACSTEAGKYLYGNNDFSLFRNSIKLTRFSYSDLLRKKIRSLNGWSPDDIVVGHVGRFNKQKNHKFILDVFQRLLLKNSKFRLCLCGDGELIEFIKKEAIDLKIIDRITFTGNVTNVNEYYNAFDIFIMPSLYEGLPVSGIEAQTNGLKCIFSDTISQETGLVKENVLFLPINQGSQIWVDSIVKNIQYQRESREQTIREAGYDIDLEVKKLALFFRGINND